ncbi:MAG TPA: NAD(P)/FAD-dependent oxidoreductase [Pseudonocardiaceae bacterium]|jgi:2-polyprenyl-6-methoxyphenol hydroxylase-like FAD-dependent oxidoreductase|nr:NAD(P)/FAD-dependent oxidoreductase [Pseudonocardiaceae bacterium]
MPFSGRSRPLRVLVAGAGIGGLCLANALRGAGIEVEIHERERSVLARGQGYRINISSPGGAALLDCLTEDLAELYLATSNRYSLPVIAGYDPGLRELFRKELSAPPDPPRSHSAVDRSLLRQILLAGVADAVRFGKRVVGAEQDEHGVRVRFADGGGATGDLLVAADGAGSVLRGQVLPAAELVDVGWRGCWGKTLLEPSMWNWLPDAVRYRYAGVFGSAGEQLAIGVFQPRQPVTAAVAEYAPTANISEPDDYLMWMFSAPELGSDRDQAGILERIGLLIADWHPSLRRLITLTDADTIIPVGLRISRPVPAWAPGRITFLGDAIHTMSPAGGTGANTAFVDAALLARALATVDRGEADLVTAIAGYDTELRARGAAAVARSLSYGEQFADVITAGITTVTTTGITTGITTGKGNVA